MGTYTLYAAGLGLMFSSPRALGALDKGADYSEGGNRRVRIDQLIRDQQLVLVATGSPQLDYVINVHEEASSQDLGQSTRAFVRFGLEVCGGALVVRDGYDLMDWNPDEESAVVIPTEDGYYELLVGWAPSTRHAEMVLHIVPQKVTAKIPGEEMYELIYEAAIRQA